MSGPGVTHRLSLEPTTTGPESSPRTPRRLARRYEAGARAGSRAAPLCVHRLEPAWAMAACTSGGRVSRGDHRWTVARAPGDGLRVHLTVRAQFAPQRRAPLLAYPFPGGCRLPAVRQHAAADLSNSPLRYYCTYWPIGTAAGAHGLGSRRADTPTAACCPPDIGTTVKRAPGCPPPDGPSALVAR